MEPRSHRSASDLGRLQHPETSLWSVKLHVIGTYLHHYMSIYLVCTVCMYSGFHLRSNFPCCVRNCILRRTAHTSELCRLMSKRPALLRYGQSCTKCNSVRCMENSNTIEIRCTYTSTVSTVINKALLTVNNWVENLVCGGFGGMLPQVNLEAF